MVHDFYMPVNVTGYDPKDGSKVYRSVTSVLAYYHPQNLFAGDQSSYNTFGSFGVYFDFSNAVQEE